MVNKHKIPEFRERLDRALTSPSLANENSIKTIVKNQLLRSPFHGTEGDLKNIVDIHSRKVSNLIEMLRSASLSDKDGYKPSHTEWKVKQDAEQLRVMYREGPEGSPFHTLLAEGFADGPIDVCLCVSWEATLYEKWWPQYSIPAFKIIMSACMQKVRIGEEIFLVRVKVPWPMTVREALLHYFELEFFEEDLLIVLFNTIPEGEHIGLSTHGFTTDGLPAAKDAVRIDLIGGFVLQKISPTKCYFRAIANMDVKLDFVPPSLINFISRQLIGNGHKLYQKAIASVATTDQEYQEALRGQMYVRAREEANALEKSDTSMSTKDEQKFAFCLTKEDESFVASRGEELVGRKSASHMLPMDNPPVIEIEEEAKDLNLGANQITTDTQNIVTANKISPEVENALNILDRAIVIFSDLGSPKVNHIKALTSHLELHTTEGTDEAASLSVRDEQQNSAAVEPYQEVESQVFKNFRDGEVEPAGRQSSDHDQRKEPSSPAKNIGLDGRLSPTSTERPADANDERRADDSINKSQLLTLDDMSKVFDEVSAEVNGSRGSGGYESVHMSKKKKQRFCCLSFLRG